jgi:hypothetical protein
MIHSKKIKSGKPKNIWKPSSIFLNNSWVKEETMREILKKFEVIENGI